MADYSSIKNVGQTLIKLLEETIKNDSFIKTIISSNDIVLLSPKDIITLPKISLFLYRIEECNYDGDKGIRVQRLDKANALPLFLCLHYLVTPCTDQRENDHILLGKVMQVFNENRVLRGSLLYGDLNQEIKIELESLKMDDLNKIWSMLETPYRLSVGYSISPVEIESHREKAVTRVLDHINKYGILERKDENE